MDPIDLIIMAYQYEKHHEYELAEICRKAAMFIKQKEKSTAERSA